MFLKYIYVIGRLEGPYGKKNCHRGLENAARDRRPRAAFSSPRSQFFTIRTDPKPDNNMITVLQVGRSHNFVIESAEIDSFFT